MRKALYLFLVVLLSACGGGGGDGGGSTTGGTGVLTVQVSEDATGVTTSAVVFPPPEPQLVRVVVTRVSDPLFKEIQDVQLGSTPSFILPVGTDYNVDAISFANTAGLKRMLQHGAEADVVIVDGQTTNVSIVGADIAPAIILPSELTPPGPGLYAGDSYVINDTTGVTTPLQANWYLALQTSDFTSFQHIPGNTVPTDHTEPSVIPSATIPGTLYAQGEFYIDPVFLQTGENATSWVVNSLTVETPLLIHGGGIGGGIFADNFPPHVTTFAPPTVIHSPTEVSVSIGATDNVGVAGYQITESSTPPDAANGLWQTTNSFTYIISPALANGASVTLWAWAKDTSENVSAVFTERIVTYDSMPLIQSFTIPAGVKLDPVVPLTITANSYDASGLASYFVTDDPAIDATIDPVAWTNWGTPADVDNSATVQKLTYTYPGVVTTANTVVNLYAWVQDANGISSRVQTSFGISQRPQVTAFSVSDPISGSRDIPVVNFTGAAYTGFNVDGYLITESGITPAIGDPGWQATSPTTYTFVGTLATGSSRKAIVAWVKDDQGNISVQRIAYVNFTGMP